MKSSRKYKYGICGMCQKQVPIKKDFKVFRHAPANHADLCRGSGEYPDLIINENNEPEEFDPTKVNQDALKLSSMDRNYTFSEEKSAGVISLGQIYPVYTESGIVVGRARLQCGRIILIGAKWKNRSA